MKSHLFLLGIIALITNSCFLNEEKKTSATKTETGSITGSLLYEGILYEEVLQVQLYKNGNDNLPKKSNMHQLRKPDSVVITSEGSYKFKNLAIGDYTIIVIQDSIVIGKDYGSLTKDDMHDVVNIILNPVLCYLSPSHGFLFSQNFSPIVTSIRSTT